MITFVTIIKEPPSPIAPSSSTDSHIGSVTNATVLLYRRWKDPSGFISQRWRRWPDDIDTDDVSLYCTFKSFCLWFCSADLLFFSFFFLLIITAVIVIWNTSCVQLIHRVHLVNFHYFRVIRLMYLSLFNRFKYKWIPINLWTIVLNYFDYLIRYECNFLCYLIHLQLNAAIIKVILIADHITLFINNWIFQWKLTDELLDK